MKISAYTKDFLELQKQYLFFNCYVISSEKKMLVYRNNAKYNKNVDNIEVYYTPNYLYNKMKNNPIFQQIKNQENPHYYYLREHIFYYQYLLYCFGLKEKK